MRVDQPMGYVKIVFFLIPRNTSTLCNMINHIEDTPSIVKKYHGSRQIPLSITTTPLGGIHFNWLQGQRAA